MSKNAVICAIEHALRNDGCNEIPVAELYARVRKTRGNFEVSFQDFMTILTELERDGLFESFGERPELSEHSLIARSQMHPSVPYGGAIQL
jgi:hypothetical protein